MTKVIIPGFTPAKFVGVLKRCLANKKPHYVREFDVFNKHPRDGKIPMVTYCGMPVVDDANVKPIGNDPSLCWRLSSIPISIEEGGICGVFRIYKLYENDIKTEFEIIECEGGKNSALYFLSKDPDLTGNSNGESTSQELSTKKRTPYRTRSSDVPRFSGSRTSFKLKRERMVKETKEAAWKEERAEVKEATLKETSALEGTPSIETAAAAGVETSLETPMGLGMVEFERVQRVLESAQEVLQVETSMAEVERVLESAQEGTPSGFETSLESGLGMVEVERVQRVLESAQVETSMAEVERVLESAQEVLHLAKCLLALSACALLGFLFLIFYH